MVANKATIDQSPGDRAMEMVNRMDELAAKGEWNSVEQLAVRLKSAVLEIPDFQRQSLIVAVNRVFERVQTTALVSRNELKDKLTEIRRGRVAAQAYGQPAPKGSDASLS